MYLISVEETLLNSSRFQLTTFQENDAFQYHMIMNSVRLSGPCLSSVVLSHTSPRFKIKCTALIIFFRKAFSFLYNVSHFDKKHCESHLSLSLDHFVLTHPLTVDINNEMNTVLSML